MISLEQLQQLRDLVHAAVQRIRGLEQENVELRQQLQQYQGDLDGLSQENQTLEETQQLVAIGMDELLSELQDLQRSEDKEELQPRGKKIEVPKVGPNDSLQFLEQRKNVDPKHVQESDCASQSQGGHATPVAESALLAPAEAEAPEIGSPSDHGTKAVEIGATSEVQRVGEYSHSLDLSLGLGGGSLLELEENLASNSADPEPQAADDLEIF